MRVRVRVGVMVRVRVKLLTDGARAGTEESTAADEPESVRAVRLVEVSQRLLFARSRQTEQRR